VSLLRIGLIIKAIDAVFEVVGGVLLFYPRELNRWLALIFQHELVRRAAPHTAPVVEHHVTKAIYGASLAAALYLMAHGIAKIVFIGGVLKERRWGYIGLVAILVLFTIFELCRSFLDGGWAMFAFAAFDGYLAYLVWVDFRKAKEKVGSGSRKGRSKIGRKSDARAT